MKQVYIPISFIFLSLLCSSSSFKTSVDKSKLLLGRWELVDFLSPKFERNFKAAGMSAERRKVVMQDFVRDSFIEFRADGTYEVSILESEPEIRFWRLSEDQNYLLVSQLPREKGDMIEIELLTKKELRLVLSPEDQEYTRMFFIPKTDIEARK